MEVNKALFKRLDRPEILQYLFHPRPERGVSGSDGASPSLLIPVEADISIGACFHMKEPYGPNILFFHGNGEIVADYAELGPIYNQVGINFIPVDYRGYGASTGRPTIAAMMTDCHLIFDFVKNWLSKNGFPGPLLVMGRSLGSASALELASARLNEIDGLIIESGFAYAGPLLSLLGAAVDALGGEEGIGFHHIRKIGMFTKPTLVIHAEFDHIIPFSDGKTLYDACGAEKKKLLKIPGADHNDIFARALSAYMTAIAALANQTMPAVSG